MRREERVVYITQDGKEFTSESAAAAHEKKLQEKDLRKYTKNAVPVRIYTNPDTTEGRHGPKTLVYGVVYASYNNPVIATQFATLYAYHKYGAPVTFCMGVFGGNAIMPNWRASTARWEDLPDEVDFVVVGNFADVKGPEIYPHKERFGNEEWMEI